jgi:AmmeMemoRadiSam system protein B/AmmeMemoRadiSam system protein A
MAGTLKSYDQKDKKVASQRSVSKSKEPLVLNSSLAGSWYPASARELENQIDGFLKNVPDRPDENFMALILPHAGYKYSGQTAVYGLKSLNKKSINTVIVLGPSHRYPLLNSASIPSVDYISTPLGKVELDQSVIRVLKKEKFIVSKSQVHMSEHSVQMEIPLLQRILGNFKIVPVVLGQLDKSTIYKMASLIKSVADSHTLVIASSDFVHFGPSYGYVPFKLDVEKEVKKLNMGAVKFIMHKDTDGFLKYINQTRATICGRIPIAVLLATVPKRAEAMMFHYETSIPVTGDKTNFVSYISMGFKGSFGKGVKSKMTDINGFVLDNSDKIELLKLARISLEYYLKNGVHIPLDQTGITITPHMKQIMGAFVTLKRNGDLRGCIGEIFPRRELYKAVMDHAVDAAVHDPRFNPVGFSELSELIIEISALTKPVPIAGYKDFIVGRHGIVLSKAGRSAVFLPQVAPEQGWQVEQTLTHLSLKAGLPADAWKSGASFSVFEAIVFGEDSF